MKLGASFSHPHLISLNIDPLKAIKEFKSLGLSWIRLGCYWNEIEKEPGKFNFSQLDPLVEFCEKNNIKVVLTVGMKAPRWPEYYLPHRLDKKLNLRQGSSITTKNKYLSDTASNSLKAVVNRYKTSPAIRVWQVENEPMDPSGPNKWEINIDFLEKEISTVRKLDTERKILINLWGNELSKRGVYKKVVRVTDILGLDLYLREPGQDFERTKTYIGPSDTKKEIRKIIDKIKSQGKQIWITELQAEPWEPGEIVTSKKNPPSFLPKHFETNLNYAKEIEPEVTLLWGFEYWYLRKTKGDSRYWNAAKEAISKF